MTANGNPYDTISSAPRNPTILKLFRYAKLSENAGYGIDKIYSWERLTDEKVEFSSDLMSTTVTYWRPKVGTSVKRSGVSEGTTPTITPTAQKEKDAELRQKMIRIMKATKRIRLIFRIIVALCVVHMITPTFGLQIPFNEWVWKNFLMTPPFHLIGLAMYTLEIRFDTDGSFKSAHVVFSD